MLPSDIHKRIFRGLLVILFIHLSTNSWTQTEPVQIRLLSSPTKALDPGNDFKLVFEVLNQSKKTQEILLNPSIPKGWTEILNQRKIVLKQSEKKIKIISIHIPDNEKVGTYPLAIEVVSPGDSSSINRFETEIQIKPFFELSIETLSQQEHIFAGDTFYVEYLIQNKSNIDADFEIAIHDGSRLEKLIQEIPSDSFIIKQVWVPSRENIQSNILKTVHISAGIKDSANLKKVVSSVYNIIPNNKAKFDPYERFPIRISGLIASDNKLHKRGYISMFDISGGGIISPKNKRNITFQFRGPNRRGEPIMGTHDNYFIKYVSKNGSITLGDDNYRLTSLTESARYGRGLKIEYKSQRSSLGTFINFPRFYPDVRQITSLYFKYHKSNQYQFTTAYLSKLYIDKHTANLLTVQGRLQPFRWGQFDAEIAAGAMNGQVSKAFNTNLKTQFKKVKSFFNFTLADRDFPGYYSNTKNVSGGLTFNVQKKTQCSFNYNSSYANLALDTMYANAPFTNNLGTRIRYRINDKHSFSIGVIQRKRTDRMPIKLFDYVETNARTDISSNIGSFILQFSGEIGKTRNLLQNSDDKSLTTSRAGLNMKYKFRKKIDFNGFVNYQGNQQYLIKGMQDIYYGGTLNMKLASLTLSARYQSSFQLEDYYKDRSICDLSIQYQPSEHHHISTSTSYNLVKNSLDKKELRFYLKYTYIINAPLVRKGNIGSLSGRIINNGIESVKGIQLSMNGNVAVTDEDGFFQFPVVQAGNNLLTVNTSRLGLNAIAEKAGPYKITILPGQEQYFELGFTKSARIEGKTDIIEDQNLAKKEFIDQTERFDKLIVEIKNKDELYRTITNPDGSFQFNDLRPGKWTFKVYKTGLPKGYELVAETFTIELISTEVKEIEVKIRKKARKIKFQNSFQKKPQKYGF